MLFNPDKSEIVNFTRKRKTEREIEVTMDNTLVTQVFSHKHLGVILQSDGKWAVQTEELIKRTSRRLDILNSVRNLLDRSSLEKLYKTYIRPILEYGDVVWSNINRGEVYELEKLQLKAARIVCGAKKGTSHNRLYEELGWETLEERRKYHCLTQMYRIIHKQVPTLLSEIMPANINQRNPYNTRNTGNIDLPRTNTDSYARSFIPETCKCWNNLPEDIKSLNDMDEFRERTKPQKEDPPDFYRIGERRYQVFHTRLRLKNADLRENLHRRNLAETEECSCGGGPETTEHYLLNCTNYSVERQELISIIEPLVRPLTISSNLLIWGSINLDNATNSYLVLECMKFIKATKRFV